MKQRDDLTPDQDAAAAARRRLGLEPAESDRDNAAAAARPADAVDRDLQAAFDREAYITAQYGGRMTSAALDELNSAEPY